MAKGQSNRPAEIFGYPIGNKSDEAQDARQRQWCPFINKPCDKRSGLVDYPLGVCSVEHQKEFSAICPHRFEEQGTIQGIPQVLEDIVLHYFGDLDNIVPFSGIKLPYVGMINYILIRYKPIKAEIDDFVMVEFQPNSVSEIKRVVQARHDFAAGLDIRDQNYSFSINTYDTFKRLIPQLLNKGIVYEAWNIKGYWVIQERVYANLVKQYGFKESGYSPEHASRLALYNLAPLDDRLILTPSRYISTIVDEVYQIMRNNPGLPSKDEFVQILNTKLRAKLIGNLGKLMRTIV
ncbi:MAG: NotI family restriction endonuclease [Chloroflexota bacterium]